MSPCLSVADRACRGCDYLNAGFSYNGIELHRIGSAVRLGAPARFSSVVDALVNASS
jgi:hypothetical protein